MDGISLPCQKTGKITPLKDGHLVAVRNDGSWYFRSKPSELESEFSVPVSSLIQSPEHLIAWLTHLHSRSWFDMEMFMTFMHLLQNVISRQTWKVPIVKQAGMPD